MRVLLGCALVLASCGESAGTHADFVAHGVSSRLVRQIERRVVMPPMADELGAYDRYYTRPYGADVVRGVFLRPGFPRGLPLRLDGAVPLSGVPGAFALEERRLPIIFDGGCAVVNAEFDLPAMGLAPPSAEDSLFPDLYEQEGAKVECGGI